MAAAATAVSNGHLPIEIDQKIHTIPSELNESPHHPLRNSQSIPYFHQSNANCNFNNGLDSYSFNDIEIASSVNDQKCPNFNATPKSIISHKLSLAATNLSSCSTQSLLQKLLDKAQILDEYYQDISDKPKTHPTSPSAHSSSSNSLLERRSTTPGRSFFRRNQSNDSLRKSQQRKYRNIYDNFSSDSSRFNLYDDEDNILRELVRFNNDIDLILSRLEMEGENLQQTTDQPSLDENLIEPADLSAPPQHDQ